MKIPFLSKLGTKDTAESQHKKIMKQIIKHYKNWRLDEACSLVDGLKDNAIPLSLSEKALFAFLEYYKNVYKVAEKNLDIARKNKLHLNPPTDEYTAWYKKKLHEISEQTKNLPTDNMLSNFRDLTSDTREWSFEAYYASPEYQVSDHKKQTDELARIQEKAQESLDKAQAERNKMINDMQTHPTLHIDHRKPVKIVGGVIVTLAILLSGTIYMAKKDFADYRKYVAELAKLPFKTLQAEATKLLEATQEDDDLHEVYELYKDVIQEKNKEQKEGVVKQFETNNPTQAQAFFKNYCKNHLYPSIYPIQYDSISSEFVKKYVETHKISGDSTDMSLTLLEKAFKEKENVFHPSAPQQSEKFENKEHKVMQSTEVQDTLIEKSYLGRRTSGITQPYKDLLKKKYEEGITQYTNAAQQYRTLSDQIRKIDAMMIEEYGPYKEKIQQITKETQQKLQTVKGANSSSAYAESVKKVFKEREKEDPESLYAMGKDFFLYHIPEDNKRIQELKKLEEDKKRGEREEFDEKKSAKEAIEEKQRKKIEELKEQLQEEFKSYKEREVGKLETQRQNFSTGNSICEYYADEYEKGYMGIDKIINQELSLFNQRKTGDEALKQFSEWKSICQEKFPKTNINDIIQARFLDAIYTRELSDINILIKLRDIIQIISQNSGISQNDLLAQTIHVIQDDYSSNLRKQRSKTKFKETFLRIFPTYTFSGDMIVPK